MNKNYDKIRDAVDELTALKPAYDSLQKRNKCEGYDMRFHEISDQQKAEMCVKGERRARNRALYKAWLARGNKATPLIYIPPTEQETEDGKI